MTKQADGKWDNVETGLGKAANEVLLRHGTLSAIFTCALFLAANQIVQTFYFHDVHLQYIPPFLFSIGMGISFYLIVISGFVLAPIAWFIIGCGIYFGLGTIAGLLSLHPYTQTLFGSGKDYIFAVNKLNGISVLIVLIVAFFVYLGLKKLDFFKAKDPRISPKIFNGFFPIAALFAFFVLSCSTLAVIYEAGHYVVSILNKVYPFVSMVILVGAANWGAITKTNRCILVLLVLMDVMCGFLLFSKFKIIFSILAFCIGRLVCSPKFITATLGFLAVSAVFVIVNPIISAVRLSVDYEDGNFGVSQRLNLLLFATQAIYLDGKSTIQIRITNGTIVPMAADEIFTREEKVKSVGRRFELSSVQAFLLREHDEGRSRDTLSKFWMTFIPRAVWPSKPVITSNGTFLHQLYFNDPSQVSSSLAPTYSAEAYWNGGIKFVFLISSLIGISIGIFTYFSFMAMNGRMTAYFFVAFPIIVWAFFVESWLVSTYLGEFIIFLAQLLLAQIFLKLGLPACVKFIGKNNKIV